MARIGDYWSWSSLSVPSTHIFKPPPSRIAGVAELELGGQLLARRIGLDAAEAQVLAFRGQRSYVTTRFDRVSDADSGVTRRIHTEDLTQAMGIPPTQKYQAALVEIGRLFLRRRAGDDVAYGFLEQVAYNTALGNADAHAKNYSVMLEGPLRISPIYDAVPTRMWPHFDISLSKSRQ